MNKQTIISVIIDVILTATILIMAVQVKQATDTLNDNINKIEQVRKQNVWVKAQHEIKQAEKSQTK